MGSQTPALEKLFDEWEKKHAEKISTDEPYLLPEQEEPYGGFVRDGIINLESWKKQKVRICFILNEAGGSFERQHYPNNFDLAAEWNEKGSFSKFMFKLCVWTRAIQDAFVQPVTYKKAEVSKVRDDIIRSIAVINIKKSDGQRKSDFDSLQRFANEDAEEIRREIELVNPNIVICCDNLNFLREPLPFDPKKNKNKKKKKSADLQEIDSETQIEVINPETETGIEIVSFDSETQTADTNTRRRYIFEPPLLPKFREDGKRNYVFNTEELKPISKFTYLWGSKLIFGMWTPANFYGTISSNTLNYYAVRGIVRAALKAFGDKQRRDKIQQMQEQRHQEKLKLKAERQAQAAAKSAAKAETESNPVVETPSPAEVKPIVETPPTPEVYESEIKPATKKRVTRAKAEPKADAEAKPKTTRTRTKTKAE